MTTKYTMSTTAHQLALASHLGISADEITESGLDHYGLPVFDADGGEYIVATDAQADEACEQYVRDSVWAFHASFILGECDLPLELEDAIKAFQEDKCESANDALLALVEKCCGIEAFTKSAIRADGRGHFLSPYDGNENEVDLEWSEEIEGEQEGDSDAVMNGQRTTFFIYRTN